MKNNKGFTLIELIIVISIIALLSTIGITTYSSIQKDARNAKRKADLKELKTALEEYKAKNDGDYPVTGANIWFGTCNTSTWSSGGVTYNGLKDDNGSNGYIPDLAPEFIPKLPRDPRENKANTSSADTTCQTTAGQNCYMYSSDGTDYKLIANCTPEGTLSDNDAYFDSARSDYAWQVSSSSNSVGW